MQLSRRLVSLPGIEDAALMIGTPSNKALLRDAGLLDAEGEAAGANDIVMAVRARDEGAARCRRFPSPAAKGASALAHARSLRGALDALSHANLAVICAGRIRRA